MSKTKSDFEYIQNKLYINLVADLNVGITLTTDLDSQACSLLASLGWGLFWKINK